MRLKRTVIGILPVVFMMGAVWSRSASQDNIKGSWKLRDIQLITKYPDDPPTKKPGEVKTTSAEVEKREWSWGYPTTYPKGDIYPEGARKDFRLDIKFTKLPDTLQSDQPIIFISTIDASLTGVGRPYMLLQCETTASTPSGFIQKEDFGSMPRKLFMDKKLNLECGGSLRWDKKFSTDDITVKLQVKIDDTETWHLQSVSEVEPDAYMTFLFHYRWMGNGSSEASSAAPSNSPELNSEDQKIRALQDLIRRYEEPTFSVRENVTFDGGDYRNFDAGQGGPEVCRSACASEPSCKAFTYVRPGAFTAGATARCWLKSTVPTGTTSSCCVSGVKSGSTAP